jgi:hypothetical protein
MWLSKYKEKYMSSEEQKLRDRIAQLERDYELKGWLRPDEPDATLAEDEWYAVINDYRDKTSGYLTKIQPKAISNMSSVFKVKRVAGT